MSISTKNKHNHLLMFILTLGVFGILNTEMGVVGIIPIIAETFGVTVPDAGWTVSLFALIIAFSAPVVPLLFSRVNRKTVMVLALSLIHICQSLSSSARTWCKNRPGLPLQSHRQQSSLSLIHIFLYRWVLAHLSSTWYLSWDNFG